MTVQQAFKNTLVVLGTIVAAYLLLMSVRILVVLVVAVIIASAVRPLVVWLTKRKVPEGIAIILVYLIVLGTILGLMVVVLPPVVQRFGEYVQSEQFLANRINNAQMWVVDNLQRFTGAEVTPVSIEQIEDTITSTINRVERAGPELLGEAGTVAGEAILVFVMGAFWLTSHASAVNFVTELFPLKDRGTVKTIITEIEGSLGSYVRGIVLVASFVGIANFVILSLFRFAGINIPNPATLGFIVGITTMLPIIGGFIGGGLATIIAGLDQPLFGVITFFTFVAVQQIENHYLTPKVMANSIGVNPLLVIIGVFVGFSIGGVIGALIAIPILGTVNTLLKYLVFEPRRASVQPFVKEAGVILLNTGEELKVHTEVTPAGASTTIETPGGATLITPESAK